MTGFVGNRHKAILTGPKDWELWNTAIRTVANTLRIWELCDPDGVKVSLSEPTIPEEPLKDPVSIPTSSTNNVNEQQWAAYVVSMALYDWDVVCVKEKREIWNQ